MFQTTAEKGKFIDFAYRNIPNSLKTPLITILENKYEMARGTVKKRIERKQLTIAENADILTYLEEKKLLHSLYAEFKNEPNTK